MAPTFVFRSIVIMTSELQPKIIFHYLHKWPKHYSGQIYSSNIRLRILLYLKKKNKNKETNQQHQKNFLKIHKFHLNLNQVLQDAFKKTLYILSYYHILFLSKILKKVLTLPWKSLGEQENTFNKNICQNLWWQRSSRKIMIQSYGFFF